jgi:hypothetical protein
LPTAAVLLLGAALLSARSPARASGRIDVSHAPRDRQSVDACIIRGVVINTDPYIGANLRHDDVITNIAEMCARPFARYAEDWVLDAAAPQPVMRWIIEAGLRGQFRDDDNGEALRDAR